MLLCIAQFNWPFGGAQGGEVEMVLDIPVVANIEKDDDNQGRA